MTWYYVRGQERVGPVDSSQFNALISDGTIAPDTLVWRDGMAKWQRFGELGDMAATGEESTEAVCSQTVRANPVCAECGQVFPADDMIRYDNQWVCATCKPIFFQRVKEGALTGAFSA